jgi:hypothetical protein
MAIVNVQNVASPFLQGKFISGSAFTSYLYSVTVSGSFAYLTDFLLPGVRIVNISNPANPTQVGIYQNPDVSAYDVAVNGNTAYLGMSNGLGILDVSVPSNPTLISILPIGTEVFSVVVSGNTAYLCAGTGGVVTVDVSAPAIPVVTGQYDTGHRAGHACFYYDNLLVADGSDGVYQFRDDALTDVMPTSPSIELRAYPNPFNPSTTISFNVPERGHVELIVLDVRGTTVRSLADASYEAGAHVVMWDGFNDVGQPVASGVYFCQLRGKGFAGAAKIVLTK